MPRRAPSHARSRNPTFLWQGTLILLPAIILCAVGLDSLRQDRALAEHQALERARTIARESLQRIVQGPLSATPLPDATLLMRASTGLDSPEDDPIWQAARAPVHRVSFFLDDAGRLVYPPPIPSLPLPQPLDPADLNAEQLALWEELEDRITTGLFSGANDPLLTAFVKTAPPSRFAAIAEYRGGMACLGDGQRQEAMTLFRAVSEGNELAEDGFPLPLFAGAQIVRQLALLPEAARKAAVDRFCARAIAQPTVLTNKALEWAGQYDRSDDAATRWKALAAMHDRARTVAAEGVGPFQSTPVEIAGETHFVISRAATGGHWVQVISRRDLAAAIEQIKQAQGIPEQFALEVALGPLDLLPRRAQPDGGEALATSTASLSGEGGDLPLTIRISLADPARYFADQRLRTLRFAALIGISALAVLIGFFSAWRAFRRQQRLSEMKTNFVSSVSHELRAPIASVRFMAEELEMGAAPSPDKLRNYHRFIVQECRRLSAVIENVLDFSRREQGRERFEFEASDLVRLLEETAGLMRTYGADRGVTIETEVRGEPDDVAADGRALQRLLVNLLDNAIKHSPEDGCVRTGLLFEPRRVLLWVEDDGPGIPREEQARIFDRFYRVGSELRRETQGVGLGLSIVKHIASVHGGTVHVRSEVGHGSRFTLELPFVRKSGMPLIES